MKIFVLSFFSLIAFSPLGFSKNLGMADIYTIFSQQEVRKTALSLDDMNHDGILDLIVWDVHSAQLMIRYGNGDGTFKDPSRLAFIGGSLSVFRNDLDRDGRNDLIIPQSDKCTVDALYGEREGGFSKPSKIKLCEGSFEGFTMGDVNEDGILDIVFTKTGDSVPSILLGDGRGHFSEKKK